MQNFRIILRYFYEILLIFGAVDGGLAGLVVLGLSLI
jgi:hypothetical protein